MDLEAKIAAKGEDYSGKGDGNNGNDSSSSSSSSAQDTSRRLPKGPARAVLPGHRGPITSVAVHPVYR